MARTDTLGNFLTDVADAIREKKGTSDAIQASDFDTEIANLPSGGANETAKIDSSCIHFTEVTGATSINAPTVNKPNYPNLAFKDLGTYKGIVFCFVRSDYTLSSNLELIAESEWFTYDNIEQKLVVCWCDDLSKTMTISQSLSKRIEAGTIAIRKGTKPGTVILNLLTQTTDTLYTVNPTNNLCIYIVSSIYNYADDRVQNAQFDNFEYVYIGKRIATFISTNNRQKDIMLSGASINAIIGIEIQLAQ